MSRKLQLNYAYLGVKLFCLALGVWLLWEGITRGELARHVDWNHPLPLTVIRAFDANAKGFYRDFRVTGLVPGDPVPVTVNVYLENLPHLAPGATYQVYRTTRPDRPYVSHAWGAVSQPFVSFGRLTVSWHGLAGLPIVAFVLLLALIQRHKLYAFVDPSAAGDDLLDMNLLLAPTERGPSDPGQTTAAESDEGVAALVQEAESHLEQRQYEQALHVSRNIISRRPQDPVGYELSACAQAGSDGTGDILPYLERALTSAPESAAINHQLSVVHRLRKNYDLGRHRIRKAIDAEPEVAAHWYELATLQASEDGAEDVLPYLERILTGAPDSPSINHSLAVVYRLRKRYPLARRHIAKAIEAKPKVSMYWSELATLCYHEDELEAARRCAHRALVLDSQNAEALNLISGSLLGDRDNSEAAISLGEARLRKNPRDAHALNDLGVAYLNVEKYGRAEAYFRQAVAAEPDRQLFRRNLYTALRHQAGTYRFLVTPYELGRRLGSFWMTVIFILLLPVMLTPFGLAVVVWFLLLWFPLLKFYEVLTISDVKARAGEPVEAGGQLGGLNRWPFVARFLVFVGVALSVSSAVGFAIARYYLARFIALCMVGVALAAAAVAGLLIERRERRRKEEVAGILSRLGLG